MVERYLIRYVNRYVPFVNQNLFCTVMTMKTLITAPSPEKERYQSWRWLIGDVSILNAPSLWLWKKKCFLRKCFLLSLGMTCKLWCFFFLYIHFEESGKPLPFLFVNASFFHCKSLKPTVSLEQIFFSTHFFSTSNFHQSIKTSVKVTISKYLSIKVQITKSKYQSKQSNNN